MKKPLALRRETIRTLSRVDLARIVGGAQSGDKGCSTLQLAAAGETERCVAE